MQKLSSFGQRQRPQKSLRLVMHLSLQKHLGVISPT